MSVDDFLGGGFMQGDSGDEDDVVSSMKVLMGLCLSRTFDGQSGDEALDDDEDEEDASSVDADDNESFADVDDLEGTSPRFDSSA